MDESSPVRWGRFDPQTIWRQGLNPWFEIQALKNTIWWVNFYEANFGNCETDIAPFSSLLVQFYGVICVYALFHKHCCERLLILHAAKRTFMHREVTIDSFRGNEYVYIKLFSACLIGMKRLHGNFQTG